MHCIPCGRADAGKLLRIGKRLCPPGANPVAWDGLGPGPTEDAQPLELRPEQHARAKHEIILGPLNAAPAEPNRKVQS